MFENKREGELLESRRIVTLIVVAIVAIHALSGLAIMAALDKWSDRADFGGMFGAASSLFSGLALAGVVYAILLQRQELSLQRQELAWTRKELERAATAQEHSAQLLHKQLTAMETAQQRQESAERARVLPFFTVQNCSSSGGRMQFELENHGSGVVDLEVRKVLNASLTLADTSAVESGGVLKSVVETGTGRFSFELLFTDVRGDRRALEIAFTSANRRLSVREVDT